jgi:RHS repeat-associated protein
VLRVRGNAAEVPGTCVPWLPFVPLTSPGAQSINAQNRLGGSAEARERASGPSWSATLDCYWGSRTPAGSSRQVDGTTRYLLDGLSVIAQYGTDGTRQAWYTQSLARIDEVLSVVNDSGKQWYQADALGSVYGLTNQAGVLVGNQNYDVFGAPTPAPSGPAGQPFGFTGREHELDSGLVYARARYLNPGTGGFASADPLGGRTTLARVVAFSTEGPGLYAYVRNRVTVATDPSGMWCRMNIGASDSYNGWPKGYPVVPHPLAPGFCAYSPAGHTNGYLDMTFHRGGPPIGGRWGPHINYKVHPIAGNGIAYATKPLSNLHSGIIWRDDGQICYRHGYTGTAMGNTQTDSFCVSTGALAGIVLTVALVVAASALMPEIVVAEGVTAGAAALFMLLPSYALASSPPTGGCNSAPFGDPPSDGDDD